MTIIFFSSCKEELLQPKEEETKPKVTDAKVVSETLIDAQLVDRNPDKNEKFEKYKKEHALPFALLKKPEEILREFLDARKNNKASVTSNKNLNLKSVTALCNPIEIEVWVLENYTPNSGTLGIQPSVSWMYDSNSLSLLKNTYGFSNVLMEEMAARKSIDSNYAFNRYELYLAFDFPGMIIQCIDAWDLGYIAGCYIDEPTEIMIYPLARQILQNDIIPRWRNKFGYSSQIVLGDRTHRLVNEFDDLVDVVNQSSYWDYSYYSWGVLDYFYTEDDQRDAWNSFNSSFSSKFNCLWISSNSDQGEFYSLLGHAKNLGKNSVWLWNCGDWNVISSFSYWAWQTGWLHRVTRKYIYVYNYVGYTDPCTDNNIDHWDLTDIYPTNTTLVN
jgi:hypothetical protein